MTRYIKSKKFCKNKYCHGLRTLSILIVFLIICSTFLYIIQTNSLVGTSYQIREQKQRFDSLESANKNLEMEIAQSKSPINLGEAIESLGMVELDQVRYLGKEKVLAAKE
ncbi:MAG: hypothetical protein CMI55_00590 [Parcubacteria group bacterium]|jgi:hypothetical protein|nr:hypothetical protein [Parcubacteria group bacterium]|tara:strand:- start:318 stop:647 length:330 start_codon:yes stop_codon:yes gene_type:complete